MDKFSELKAAALAATPGPWAAELDEVWVISDGTADFMVTDIFGDNDLSAHQDCANAKFIAAANPAAIIALLAELEDKGREINVWRQRCENAEKGSDQAHQRIAELEEQKTKWVGWSNELGAKLDAAEKRLATPVRLPDDGLEDCQKMFPLNCDNDFDTGYNFGLYRYEQNIRAAGFKVEGDE